MRSGRLGKKGCKNKKPLALTFTHTTAGEEGTGIGSLCLRTPEKKKENREHHQSGGEGKTEKESVVD